MLVISGLLKLGSTIDDCLLTSGLPKPALSSVHFLSCNLFSLFLPPCHPSALRSHLPHSAVQSLSYYSLLASVKQFHFVDTMKSGRIHYLAVHSSHPLCTPTRPTRPLHPNSTTIFPIATLRRLHFCCYAAAFLPPLVQKNTAFFIFFWLYLSNLFLPWLVVLLACAQATSQVNRSHPFLNLSAPVGLPSPSHTRKKPHNLVFVCCNFEQQLVRRDFKAEAK